MKLTLLVTTFNSLSQMVYTKLKALGHQVDVVYAIDDAQMVAEMEAFNPDIIICPYLKKFVPKEIFTLYPTFIIHPGIIGDKGAFSLDNAIREEKEEWGVTILKANDTFDGGDVYAEVRFAMRKSYKASIYRQEVFHSASKALNILLKRIDDEDFAPIPQPPTPMHPYLTQKERRIDWECDTTEEIIKKVYMGDSHPGVLDEILGVPCYLYGAHKEAKFRGKPKEVLAKRDGAICLGTVDGAVWISHLKEVGKFKLPATYVLKERLKGIKEERLPLIFDRSYDTFHEVWMAQKEKVAYLHFNFHNGAMSTAQCIRLKYAVEYLSDACDVLVLMGGEDFFSNGIHLNILEDSQKQGEDGWANINAMNDLIRSILFAEDVVTIASFHRNAGAGGVFLGLACDFVVGRQGVVLNPHYKTLGLTGSEYHTYTLPKRVGHDKAQKLLDACLPISTQEAHAIGMIDAVFETKAYDASLHAFAKSKIDDDYLWEKQEYLEMHAGEIEQCKEREIEVMHPEFWEEDSPFHTLRREFVYKVCPRETPKRLKSVGCCTLTTPTNKDKVYA